MSSGNLGKTKFFDASEKEEEILSKKSKEIQFKNLYNKKIDRFLNLFNEFKDEYSDYINKNRDIIHIAPDVKYDVGGVDVNYHTFSIPICGLSKQEMIRNEAYSSKYMGLQAMWSRLKNRAKWIDEWDVNRWDYKTIIPDLEMRCYHARKLAEEMITEEFGLKHLDFRDEWYDEKGFFPFKLTEDKNSATCESCIDQYDIYMEYRLKGKIFSGILRILN